MAHERIQEAIASYLAAVSRHLGDEPADERAEILRDLETHIHDALRRRSGQSPTLADLQAVLAEMDPPESYGPGRPTPPPSIPPPASARADGPKPRTTLGPWALTMLILALVLGILSWRSPAGKVVVWGGAVILAILLALGLILCGASDPAPAREAEMEAEAVRPITTRPTRAGGGN